MPRRHRRNSWALTSAPAFLVLSVAVVLAGCNDATESALERLDVNATPAAEQLSVAEYRDLSIPEQTDVLLRFYEVDHTAECPNVEYEGGASSSLYEGVRSDSLNEPDERPMSELLIEHCSEGGTE